MDKHTKKTPSLFQYPVLVAFGLFFIGLFVLDMATPDRAYSELENTTLTQRPRLTAVSADGLNNYFTSYTRYVKDQVFGRDQWISLQSVAETTLFQKTQSGGILLGREHMMFARALQHPEKLRKRGWPEPCRRPEPCPALSGQGKPHAGAVGLGGLP